MRHGPFSSGRMAGETNTRVEDVDAGRYRRVNPLVSYGDQQRQDTACRVWVTRAVDKWSNRGWMPAACHARCYPHSHAHLPSPEMWGWYNRSPPPSQRVSGTKLRRAEFWKEKRNSLVLCQGFCTPLVLFHQLCTLRLATLTTTLTFSQSQPPILTISWFRKKINHC